MNLVLVGLNHKTAPVEIRERLAFPTQLMGEALRRLVDRERIEEGLIVSTCNRVEVLAKTIGPPPESRHTVGEFLHRYHDLPGNLVVPHLYFHEGTNAVRHIFRVASSLDSMVVGEPQILGQVKDAYSEALRVGAVGRTLNRLLPKAFFVAKRVRSETGIAAFAVSMSYVAVELSRKIFDDLRGKTALLIGAGEMAELAAKHLLGAGARRLLIANRTYKNAQALATNLGNCAAIDWHELGSRLHEADIVIASTGATSYIVDRPLAQATLERRRNRPMLFIDLSVPRNIDPAISDLDNLFVFDVDDLESVVEANRRERLREAQRAEAIIETEIEQFLVSLRQPDIGPTIAALRERLEHITHSEFDRQRKHLGPLTPEQEEAIRKHLLSSLVNKIMHPMIVGLRDASRNQQGDLLDVRRAFDLDRFDDEANNDASDDFPSIDQ